MRCRVWHRQQTSQRSLRPETSVPKTKDLIAPAITDGYVTNFDYDSAELGTDAIEHFVNIAAFLADKPDVILIVEGIVTNVDHVIIIWHLRPPRGCCPRYIGRQWYVERPPVLEPSHMEKNGQLLLVLLQKSGPRNRRAMIRMLTE